MADQNTTPAETAPDLNGFAKQIVDYFVSVPNLERIAKSQEPVLVKAIEIFLGTIIGLVGTVGAEFAKSIVNAEDIAEPAFRRLVNVALQDITGIDANINNAGGGRGGRTGAARNIGAGILQALSGISGGAVPPGGQLAPSTRAAEDYLTFVVQMGMEGWLTGLMGEMMTLGQVESLGDLDDTLANSLGLARTSRAVMRPFINTTVALPAQWHMNKTYRPELLSAALAVKLFNRKRWTREQLIEELARQGYSDDRIEALIQDAEKKPSMAQVMRAYELNYIPEADLRAFLEDDGYPDRYIDFIVQFAEVESIGKFQQDLADAAAAAYVARRITPARFNQLLSDSGIPQRDMARLRELSELKRAVNVKPLSEPDAEQAAKRKIISIPDYRRILLALGYDDEAVYVKELLLQGDINDATQKERAAAERARILAAEKAERKRLADERRAKLEAERAVTEPSIGMVERFVTRGRWSFQQYEDFLRAEKYDATTIAALLADAEQARLEYLAAIEEREQAELRAATRPIGLATLESAVMRGVATMAEYRQRLVADKYTAADQAKLVAVLQDRINEQKELEERRRLAEQRARDKGLSVAQYEQAVLRGVASLSDFEAFLASEGYLPFDRAVIVQLTARKLEDLAAAAARREQLEREADARQVRVGDVRKAVLTGLRPMEDYRRALTAALVSAEDRQLLEDLLTAEIVARQEAQRRRDEIAANAASHGPTLAQLERAVLVGAAPIEQYEAQLKTEGYNPATVQQLTAVLVERLAEQERQRVRREQLELEADARQVRVADVRKAVLIGLRPMADYRNALVAALVDADDRVLLEELLTADIVARQEAQAERDRIIAAAASHGLSLTQLERAVVAGAATVAQYQQQLREDGYNAEAVEMMTTLLLDRVTEFQRARRRRDELDARYGVRTVSPSDVARAIRAELRTTTDYFDTLRENGYDEADASLLTQLLEMELAAEQEARDLRDRIGREVEQDGVNLAQLAAAVRAGELTLENYGKSVAARGYSPADVATVVALLDREITEQDQAAELLDEETKDDKTKQLSVSQFAQAVVSGARTVTEYAAFLDSLKFSLPAQSSLVSLMLQQLDKNAGVAGTT